MSDDFTYEEVVERLAPCGIDCERCVRCAHGSVKQAAQDLAESLTGFEKMAPRMADHVPALAQYSGFVEVLDFFSQADCEGCRAGGSQLPFCATRTCFAEKGVNFCFECDEYPCERNQYPQNLAERWRACNDRMRDVGAVAYYRESLGKPRY